MKIVADQHIPYIKEFFSRYGELILKPGRAIHHADVKDADILLVRSITRVEPALLHDSAVRFVGSITAGADHLDTQWLNEKKIKWSVASGFNAPPVADYVVSVIAVLQKQQQLLSKRKTAAVIGAGNVGKLVAGKLKILGFDVILCDPIRAEQESKFFHTPLEDIMGVDLICLHVPLHKHGKHPTYHFIDKAFLQRQRSDCVLINASRGAVIQTEDLLKFGKHLVCCLDVWEHEPCINKQLLDQAYLATPHIAGYSLQSKLRGTAMIHQIAIAKKILADDKQMTLHIPAQSLMFAAEKFSWQEIVLGIFNPLLLTTVMKSKLLHANNLGELFDDMRNQFNYRYEFASTSIESAILSPSDAGVLQGLGVKF